MSNPEIPLNGFVDYLRTRGAARVDVAARHIAQAAEPYSPARDFYRRILSAIVAAHRSGDDAAVLSHALDAAPPARRGHYRAVADGWLRYRHRITGTTPVRTHTGRWRDEHLTVKVTPHLAVRHSDGRTEALFLYLKADPLPPADAHAMLWLAGEAIDEACPGAEPVIVDVRRGRAFRRRPDKPGYPVWLSAEAHGYRQLRDRLAVPA